MKAEPILDTEIVKDIGEFLECENKRDHLLYWMCIYTGLRIQDILKFRVRDVRDDRGQIKDFLYLEEQKTLSKRNIKTNSRLKKILRDYTEGKPGYERLFLSREGNNKAISRQQAYNILSEAGEVFGVRLSPHSLRKTFARRLYIVSNEDITVPMEALGHTTPNQTRRYIGITEAVINNYIQELDF